jgi:hypothetical protein
MMARKGWTRAGSEDPAALMEALSARELETLDVCRRVWEHEGDPLAVCEALRFVDVPEWLRSALFVLITDGERPYPALRRRWWRERRRHGFDGMRAALIARVRTYPDHRFSWQDARRIADEHALESYPDLPPVTDAGLKRAYDRVRRSVADAPNRYYRGRPGLHERIHAAWEELARIIDASLTPK